MQEDASVRFGAKYLADPVDDRFIQVRKTSPEERSNQMRSSNDRQRAV